MEQSATTKKTNTDLFCSEDLSDKKQIKEWWNSLAHIALKELQVKHGNTDTMMQLNKAFDNELYACRIKEKSLDQIIKGRRATTDEDVLKTLGTEFIFTKISQDVKSTFINRDPLKKMHKKSMVVSLIDQETMHNLNYNTLPKEDVLIKGSETPDHPKSIIKTNVSKMIDINMNK